MTAGVRKAALVTHVVASVGWLGTVVAYLVLAMIGLTTRDAELAAASYLAADAVTRLAIVPLCIAAVITGLIQSLGTAWGLFRNYWVIAKLALTLLGGALLFLHTSVISEVALAACNATLTSDYRPLRVQMVADGVAAIVLLVVTTGLSVYKPRGLTPYGWRRQRAERGPTLM
jgi:hypothetical protein